MNARLFLTYLDQSETEFKQAIQNLATFSVEGMLERLTKLPQFPEQFDALLGSRAVPITTYGGLSLIEILAGKCFTTKGPLPGGAKGEEYRAQILKRDFEGRWQMIHALRAFLIEQLKPQPASWAQEIFPFIQALYDRNQLFIACTPEEYLQKLQDMPLWTRNVEIFFRTKMEELFGLTPVELVTGTIRTTQQPNVNQRGMVSAAAHERHARLFRILTQERVSFKIF